TLLGKRFRICLDEYLDGLLARVDLDTNGRIAKIHLVSATIFPSDNGVSHVYPVGAAVLSPVKREVSRGCHSLHPCAQRNRRTCEKLSSDGALIESQRKGRFFSNVTLSMLSKEIYETAGIRTSSHAGPSRGASTRRVSARERFRS